MEEIINNNDTAMEEQQDNTETAQEDKQERMFTQEQVDKIISERLKKQRESEQKKARQEIEAKEADIKAREFKLSCKEYLINNNKPLELLDVIKAETLEEFENNVEKVYKSVGFKKFVAPLANLETRSNYSVNGFEDTKHIPRK